MSLVKDYQYYKLKIKKGILIGIAKEKVKLFECAENEQGRILYLKEFDQNNLKGSIRMMDFVDNKKCVLEFFDSKDSALNLKFYIKTDEFNEFWEIAKKYN